MTAAASFVEASPAPTGRKRLSPLVRTILGLGALVCVLCVLGVLIWQGVTAYGAPDPEHPSTSPAMAFLDIGVLVFREGLECILVLAALTASMTGSTAVHRRPIGLGAGLGFVGTLITWFIAIGVMQQLIESVPALDLQAATGLLAVVVLVVIMNWFFHKIYWGGWIRAHNRRKKNLLAESPNDDKTRRRLWWGLVLLGFTSLYREGFEVVLFLQSYRLKFGTSVVLEGALVGLILSGMVAVVTFGLQRRLPYRQMLVTTGVLLGGVLLVMVGEQAQEMQLAHWISTTPTPALETVIRPWMGMWFAIFPTVETLAAQAVAASVVIGSYYGARRMGRKAAAETMAQPRRRLLNN
jgi:high-affinity iron transporter